MKDRVDFEDAKCIVFNAIGVGKKNATSRRILVEKTGYSDRLIRKAIEALRHDHVILNMDNGSGYYIPADTQQGQREAAAWVSRQNRRIRSIKAATKAAVDFSKTNDKELPGQIGMFR